MFSKVTQLWRWSSDPLHCLLEVGITVKGWEEEVREQGRLSGPGQRGGVAGARGSVRLCELSKATSQETLEEQRSGASWAGETG